MIEICATLYMCILFQFYKKNITSNMRNRGYDKLKNYPSKDLANYDTEYYI